MEYIIPGFIYGLVAITMFSIGIVQYKSKKPATFYSGEKPLDEKELTDVKAWNHRHGLMWMIYGFMIVVSAITGFIVKSNLVMILCTVGGILIPIPLMVIYHHRLEKKYRIK